MLERHQKLMHARLGDRLGDYLGALLATERVVVTRVVRLERTPTKYNYCLDLDVAGGSHGGRDRLWLSVDGDVEPSMFPSGEEERFDRRHKEYLLLQAVASAGVSVPAPVGYCDDLTLLGAPFLVTAEPPGVPISATALDDNLGDPLLLLDQLAQALASVHTITPGCPSLDFLVQPDLSPGLMRVFLYRHWLDQIGYPQPALEWVLRWLERYALPLGELTLCHGAFHAGSYLVDGEELTAIVNWEHATWSDPLEDIGSFCARCWRLNRWDQEAGGIGAREYFYRAYEQASGTTIDRQQVRYWEVMSMARRAILALRHNQCFHGGQTNCLDAALAEHLVPELELAMLWEICGRSTAP